VSDVVSIIELVLFILAIFVFLLQLFAHFNLDNDAKKKEAYSLNIFWLFHNEIYNEYGKSACRIARMAFYLAIILGSLWIILYILNLSY
jgi:hypothetical protein